MELANNRRIEDLTNIWWDSNDQKKQCDRIENESDGISIKNIGGVFLVIAIGVGLSMIAFAFEYYYYKIKPQKEERLYSMRGGTNVSRIRSEVSLNDVQIQPDRQTPVDSVTRDHALNNHDAHVQNGKRNGKKSKTINHRKATFKSDRSNGTAGGMPGKVNSAHTNGHVGNGVTNSMFALDIEETVEERYPDFLRSDTNTIYTEKL